MSDAQYSPTFQIPADGSKSEKQGGIGCFWGGCLSIILFFILVLGVGYYFIKNWFDEAVSLHGSSKPIVFTERSLSDSEKAAVISKIENFKKAVLVNETTSPLVLSEEEFDYYLSSDPSLNKYKEFYRVKLEDGWVKVELSVPLANLGHPDKYFNGEGKFTLNVEDGKLALRLIEATVGDVRTPPEVTAGLSRDNLLMEGNLDPELEVLSKKLSAVEIKEKQITFKVK